MIPDLPKISFNGQIYLPQSWPFWLVISCLLKPSHFPVEWTGEAGEAEGGRGADGPIGLHKGIGTRYSVSLRKQFTIDSIFVPQPLTVNH